MGFSRFNLSQQLMKSITDMGYAEPTPIQAGAIPDAMSGRDVRGCAQTGTGKTCAFLIPIVENLIRRPTTHKPSALVLAPTRELAVQIVSVAQGLIKGTRIKTALILGGVGMHGQVLQLRNGADIVVATPGRLIDHLERRNLSLRYCKTLVMDEADRMLDMGFLPPIKQILKELPTERQTMFFSATFGHEVKSLANQFLKNPVVIELSPSTTSTSENVTQMAYPVPGEQKRALLQAILELGNMTSALVFCRTKHGADKLLSTLQDWGKKAAVIHGNRSQGQRQQALDGFRNKRYAILVATDIAARGIDVKDISHVINYDVPRHPEDYVHRIGRTGRAQAVGEAFTLVAPDEEIFLRDIEKFIRKPIPRGMIPDFPYSRPPRMVASKIDSGPSQHRPQTTGYQGRRQPGGPAPRHRGQGGYQGGGQGRPQQGQGYQGGGASRPQGQGHQGQGQGQGNGNRRRWR